MAEGPRDEDDYRYQQTVNLFPAGVPRFDPHAATAEETPAPASHGEAGARPSPSSPAPSDESPASGPHTPAGSGAKINGPLAPGQIIFDKYIVERQLGRGGMGEVWLVRHRDLDIERALKLIVPGFAIDPEIRARFKREARVMAKFSQYSHPNAVAVHDARLSDDLAIIEMEYVRGEGLNRLLTPGRPMPLDWIARILVQLCDVLQLAHSLGIVHRDLKPANLMLLNGPPPGQEHLKVLDFGIAKIMDFEGEEPQEDAEFRTRVGHFIGTMLYASPEQARMEPIDGRSDLYTVGVMLYEFLTGHRPFPGRTAQYSHSFVPPPPFAETNPEVRVPAAVEAMVMRCLAKAPADRPQSAHELADEFLRALPPSLPNVPQLPAGLSQPGPSSRGSMTPSALYQRSTTGTIPTISPPTGSTDPVPGTGDDTLVKPDESRGMPHQQLRKPETQQRFPWLRRLRIAAILIVLLAGIPLLAIRMGIFSIILDPNKRDLRLMASMTDASNIPTEGKNLIIVAAVDDVLHFRIFDRNGKRVNDTDEKKLTKQPQKIENLRKELVSLWPPHELTREEKDRIITVVTSIVKPGGELVTGSDPTFPPEGFRVADASEGAGGWPKALIDLRDSSRLVLIEGGTFMMGHMDRFGTFPGDDDQPAHLVTLPNFYMQEGEVTNGQMERYFKEIDPRGSTSEYKSWHDTYQVLLTIGVKEDEAKRHPAASVSHRTAERYAEWARGRLPTEAQWEFAARSRGQERLYVWPDSTRPGPKVANIDSVGKINAPVGDDYMSTMPGQSFEKDRTDQGIFDLAGNVREWCRDRWAPYGVGPQEPPPLVPGQDPDYVVRGADFSTSSDEFRTTGPRGRAPANQVSPSLGFRIVLEIP